MKKQISISLNLLKSLFNMMKEASGANKILEDKEFSRWAKK